MGEKCVVNGVKWVGIGCKGYVNVDVCIGIGIGIHVHVNGFPCLPMGNSCKSFLGY